MRQHLQITIDDGLAIVEMDAANTRVNAISEAFLIELDCALDTIHDEGVRGAVFISMKKHGFGVGADLEMLQSLQTLTAAEEASQRAQTTFNRIANLSLPTVACIHGACLGGMLEMALACRYRLCASEPEVQIGLPEVRLGLIPGAGGTQRLPRLIGVMPATTLITTGRVLNGREALRAGLIHDLVPAHRLLEIGKQLCLNIQTRRQYHLGKSRRLLWERLPFVLSILRHITLAAVRKKTGGHYPAPIHAVQCIFDGIRLPLEYALADEAKAFAKCCTTSAHRSLLHVWNASQEIKKTHDHHPLLPVAESRWTRKLDGGKHPCAVIGAGLMGSGIASALVQRGARVVLIDTNPESLARGMNTIAADSFSKRRKRQAVIPLHEAVLPCLTLESIRAAPIVIEAVFEDLHLKKSLLRKCEEVIPTDFIFATNTSALPITLIAKGARNPATVIGMHFFSPVAKMPLVEIVRTSQTYPQVVAAISALARLMKKQVVVVNDGPGFYTSRVLGFLLAEAVRLVTEGTAIEVVDKSMVSQGWPVGPFALLDEVGLDVAFHVLDTLSRDFSARLPDGSPLGVLVAAGLLGKKSGHGMYLYRNGRRAGVNPKAISLLRGHRHSFTPVKANEAAQRCLYAFVAEAVRCLQDNIISCPTDGDVAAIYGLGFPPFWGGPFHFINTQGAELFASDCRRLTDRYGERFALQALSEVLSAKRRLIWNGGH